MKTDRMNKFIEKCDIKYHGNIISKEIILKKFSDYMIESNDYYDNNKHETLVFHSGSDCYDVIAVTLAAVNCLDDNDLTGEEIVNNLEINKSLVSFDNDTWLYKGIETRKDSGIPKLYVHLYNEKASGKKGIINPNSHYVPFNERATGIRPLPEKNEISNKGVRRVSPSRKKFFTSIFNYDKNSIPANTDKSVLLVMPKNKFFEIVKNISISFIVNDSEEEIKLTELVSATYFSETGEPDPIGAAQSYPVLICVGNAATASELLSSVSAGDNDYKINGVFVISNETVDNGLSCLDSIFDKSFLKYWVISTNISYYNSELLLDKYENANVFSCTRDFIGNIDYSMKEDNIITRQLYNQLSLISNKKDVEFITVDSIFTSSLCSEINNKLGEIQRNENVSLIKQNFISDAYSLFCVLRNLICSVKKQNELIASEILMYEPIDNILKRIQESSMKLHDDIREAAVSVSNNLIKLYDSVLIMNNKESKLKELLSENHDKNIAVIAPKNNYDLIMRNTGFFNLMDNESKLRVSSSSRFDSNEIYDIVIMLGYTFSKTFSIYNCNNAGRVVVLGYEYDVSRYRYLEHKNRNTERKLLKRSGFKDCDENQTVSEKEDEQVKKEHEIQLQLDTDKSIQEFIAKYESKNLFSRIGYQKQFEKASVQCKYILTFEESDEKAFISEHYSAYILDIYSNGEEPVSEKEASELKEGDSLIFTMYTEETRDIVDLIMKKRIADGKYGQEITSEYRRSLRWRQTLIDGFKKRNMTLKETKKEYANYILKFKPGVTAQTIIEWMNEDSHIVHPKNVSAFKSIGMACVDHDLRHNCQEYFSSCQNIQKLRRSVLKDLGNALRAKASGKVLSDNSDFRDLYDKLDNIVTVLTVKTITEVEPREIPSGMANKPLEL